MKFMTMRAAEPGTPSIVKSPSATAFPPLTGTAKDGENNAISRDGITRQVVGVEVYPLARASTHDRRTNSMGVHFLLRSSRLFQRRLGDVRSRRDRRSRVDIPRGRVHT